MTTYPRRLPARRRGRAGGAWPPPAIAWTRSARTTGSASRGRSAWSAVRRLTRRAPRSATTTVEACAAADAVLLGAVGGPQWDDPRGDVRPEQAILRLRRDLGLFANLRPVRAVDALASASPLRPEIRAGTDMLIVRELTGGLYFGDPAGPNGPRRGGHLQLHPPRGRADRSPGLHPGVRSAPSSDQRRQGQRDGHRPAVARGRRRGRPPSSRTSRSCTPWSTPRRPS